MQQVEIIDIENKKYMVLNEITENGESVPEYVPKSVPDVDSPS